jgi:hypothetical protein
LRNVTEGSTPASAVMAVIREASSPAANWRDVAPRIGVAWAPGAGGKISRPKTVIRAGFGIFYDRFILSNTLTALRYNGVVQRQFVIANPDFFPTIPALSSLAGFQPTQTIQQVSATLRAPYIMQSAVSFEHQLPFDTTVAVTYANSHGLHPLRSQDINAPLPGTYNPLVPGSGVFPLGDPGPVFQMESAGRYNQHQIIWTGEQSSDRPSSPAAPVSNRPAMRRSSAATQS